MEYHTIESFTNEQNFLESFELVKQNKETVTYLILKVRKEILEKVVKKLIDPKLLKKSFSRQDRLLNSMNVFPLL